jgi:hypothetical protein
VSLVSGSVADANLDTNDTNDTIDTTDTNNAYDRS